LRLPSEERRNFGPCRRFARLCWTLGWAAFVVHLGMAFHHYHDWSHDTAVQHVEDVSGFGPGIYFSHLFTLLWTAEVIWWWANPTGHAARPAWVGGVLHGYMAFLTFNGTIVYEQGFIRWAGVVLFVWLAALLALWRRDRNRELSARVHSEPQGEPT
jgi:hypothetical protein